MNALPPGESIPDRPDPHDPGPPARNPLAATAMVVAVASVGFAYLPLLFFVTIPLAFAAMVLGVLGRRAAHHPLRRERGRETATVAAFIGLFSLVVGGLFALATWNATRVPPGSDPTVGGWGL